MGSDESHCNVSLITRDKVTRQCPQTTTFEEKGEPKRYRTEVPLLTSLLTARPNRLTFSGGDSVATVTLYPFPYLRLGPRSSSLPLRRQLGIKHVQATKHRLVTLSLQVNETLK